MTEYVVDTNVVLRFLRQDDPKQSPAVNALFEQVDRGEAHLVVTATVLAECAWVLSSVYNEPAAKIGDVLAKLLGRPGLDTLDPDSADTLTLLAETGLDFTDCHLAAFARRTGRALASFDQKIGKRVADLSLWNAIQ